MKHKTGYIESPPDERHRPVQQLWGRVQPVAEPAQHLDLIQHMDFVEDQGPTNSCVWNALGQQHYIALGEQSVTDRKKLSRLFGYYNTRVQHHGENRGSPRRHDVFKVIALGLQHFQPGNLRFLSFQPCLSLFYLPVKG
ncbi:hypothetical protein LCGC14_0832420, partial [marine sediment metagenome]